MKKVIVIGAGISGLTAAYWLQQQGFDVHVFEKSHRAGGVIETLRSDGYLFEKGPNSFLDNAPDTLELCDKLKLENHLLRQSMRSNARYIYLKGKLHDVPMGPGGLIKTELLSGKSKRGLLLEFWRKSNRSKEDESLAAFIRRRLGDEILNHLVTPFVSGVYAGDPEQLSLRGTFSMLYDLERDHGSLTRGMLARMRKKKQPSNEPKKPRAKHLCSFIDGMQTLTEALARQLGGKLHLNTAVHEISKPNTHGFTVHLEQERINSDILILATPSYATAQMIHTLLPKSAGYFSTIPYNALAVVGLGYPREQVQFDCKGFGFLVPRNQDIRILGSIWGSSLFPLRAPGGYHSFSVFIGGGLDPTAINLTDDELIAQIKSDLHTTVGATGEPAMLQIVRWTKAIPQYPIGHVDYLTEYQQEQATVPGLYCTGNYFDGVSVNDCIRNAKQIAETVARQVQ